MNYVMKTSAMSLAVVALLLSTAFAANSSKGQPDIGRGPFYQAELLFRGGQNNRLYLGRSLISSSSPSTGTMPALTLDNKGRPVAPPDPGYMRKEQKARIITRDASSQPMPKSRTTHLYGFSLAPAYAKPGFASIRMSDMATDMRLPVKVGEVTMAVFAGAVYRIQRLSIEQAKAFNPLRDDPKFYRKRTAELSQELLNTHKAIITANNKALADAAVLLRDPDLIKLVRSTLRRWVDKTPDQVDGKGFPNALCDALERIGTAEDLKLFHRLLEQHPGEALRLTYRIPPMAKRLSMRQAKPLLFALLDDNTNSDFFSARVALLLRLDKSVPKPTCSDAILQEMTAVFKLDPAKFGMTLVKPTELRKMAIRQNFTQRQLANMKEMGLFRAGSKDWVMLKKKDRQRGVRRMRAWIDERIKR